MHNTSRDIILITDNLVEDFSKARTVIKHMHNTACVQHTGQYPYHGQNQFRGGHFKGKKWVVHYQNVSDLQCNHVVGDIMF